LPGISSALPYLDVILVFSTATIFIAVVSRSAGSPMSSGHHRLFYNPAAALLALMIIVLVRRAGAGSVASRRQRASRPPLRHLGVSQKVAR
jgi:hypothetical protein